MESVLVISLVASLLLAAGLGLGVGLLVVRGRRHTHDQIVAQLAAELAVRHDDQAAGMVERVVAVAGESFDGRLQTGTAELDRRREAIDLSMTSAQKRLDEQLGVVVASLQSKIEEVDKIVAERVGGLSATMDASVGGMSKNLGSQVTAMSSELQQVRLLVAQLQKERVQQHGQFVESLAAATRQQNVLAETTQQLREALASPQARGQWGERMAEDVLRSAGMREGINYRKQATIEGGTRPDFTFLLPDDRHLHMDVKFPVTNYLRHLEASTEIEAAASKERFLRDVRDRVKELSGRGYAAADTTVGYLLLFIPNESVYGFIHENDAGLLDDALGQKVVLCSPTSLFAVLAVIRQAMDTFAVEQATEEILECLAGFGLQWQKFSGQIDKVERHIATLTNSFGELSGTRRRQLERQLDRIEDVRSRSGVADDAPVLGPPSSPVLRDVTAG